MREGPVREMPGHEQSPPTESVPAISPKRSLAKAVSWRVVGTTDTLLLSFVVLTFLGPMLGADAQTHTENAKTATLIAITEVITKMILYYVHEQLWGRAGWGVFSEAGRRRETKRRSGAKTATWRVTASLDTMLLALLFTGSLGTAISIGTLEVLTKLLLYYFHERAWGRIQWGTQP